MYVCESILSFFRVFYIHLKRKMPPIQSKFATEFVCQDGQRIPILKVGDGRRDCWTGEDEDELVYSDSVIDYPQTTDDTELDVEDEVKGTADGDGDNGDNVVKDEDDDDLFSPDKRAAESKTVQFELVPELVAENIRSGIVIKDYMLRYDETSHSLHLENTHHKLSAALSLDQLSHLMRTGGHSFRIVNSNSQSGLGGEGGGDCGGVQQNGGLLDLPGEIALSTLLAFVGIGVVVNEVNQYRTSGQSLTQYMSQRVIQLWEHTVAAGYSYIHSKISGGGGDGGGGSEGGNNSKVVKKEEENNEEIKKEKTNEEIKKEKNNEEEEDLSKIKTEKVEITDQTIKKEDDESGVEENITVASIHNTNIN